MMEMTLTTSLIFAKVIAGLFLFLAGLCGGNRKLRSFLGFGIVGLVAISLSVPATVQHGRMLALADMCVDKTQSEASKEERIALAENMDLSMTNTTSGVTDYARTICVERIRAQQDAD